MNPTGKRWLLVLFFATRFLIWYAQPTDFTEIIYSYMPYAHLWASGVTPYRQQWYEYPPLTIPLFYAPHFIDRETHDHWWHLNYSQVYRLIVLSVDCGLFWVIWKTLERWRVKPAIFTTAVVYYCLITLKAHDFLYDSMDWVFVASIVAGIGVGDALRERTYSAIPPWLGLWVGTGLKYLNAPLAAPFALRSWFAEKKKWWQLTRTRGWLLASIGGTFLVVWTIPLILFRSSLSVSLVYHQLRGLQIDTTGALIARTATLFTHSEQFVEAYKNYEVSGPISAQILRLTQLVFALSLSVFIAGSSYLAFKQTPLSLAGALKNREGVWQVWLVLGYFLVFLLTAKVASRPFFLWFIPLITLFPFQTSRDQWWFIGPSALFITLSLSPMPNWSIGVFPLPLLVGWIRVLCLGALLGRWIYQTLSLRFMALAGKPSKRVGVEDHQFL